MLAAMLLMGPCGQGFAAAPAAPPQSPRLAALGAAVAQGDGQAIGQFWQDIERTHTPLIETVAGNGTDMLVTFLWRAAHIEDELNLSVASPLVEPYAPRTLPEPLAHLAATDVWYRSYRVTRQARFAYSLMWPLGHDPSPDAQLTYAVDGTSYEFFLDPRNPKVATTLSDEKTAQGWTEKSRRSSYAEGPDAAPEPYLAERAGVARGAATTMQWTSELLKNDRQITFYTPPGLPHGSAACDFLLIFDRAEYLSVIPTPTLLDNMQADGVLRPIVAVFVGNAANARGTELPGNALFQQFIARELMPWVRAHYRFSSDPQRAVVAGSSYGGLAAAYAGLSHPELFGNVLSQSGSYWWWPDFHYSGGAFDPLSSDSGWMIGEYARAAKLPVRFYLDVGMLEGRLMLLPNRMLREVLTARGRQVSYHEFAGAHDYMMWRSTLPQGLTALIGRHPPRR